MVKSIHELPRDKEKNIKERGVFSGPSFVITTIAKNVEPLAEFMREKIYRYLVPRGKDNNPDVSDYSSAFNLHSKPINSSAVQNCCSSLSTGRLYLNGANLTLEQGGGDMVSILAQAEEERNKVAQHDSTGLPAQMRLSAPNKQFLLQPIRADVAFRLVTSRKSERKYMACLEKKKGELC